MTEPTTPETLRGALKAEIADAISYCDTEIGPLRSLATKYYHGYEFGDEEDGRSRVVMPVVRDTVKQTLPALMRTFFGSRRVLEFAPSARMSDIDAEDATETVNYVFTRLNDGWTISWNAFKDALVRKTGWFKWWWDETVVVTRRVFTGVSEEQLLDAQSTLDQYEELEVLEQQQVGMTDPQPIADEMGQPVVDPMTGQPVMAPPQPVFEYKIAILCKKPRKQVRVAAVPPDEVLINRDARDIESARIVIHRTSEPRGDLLARGVPRDLLDKAQLSSANTSQADEQQARQPGGGVVQPNLSGLTWDQVKVDHYECYWRVDADGDGISELRRVCVLGQDGAPYEDEIVDEVPMAVICPDPEPHVVHGLSQADSTADLQLIESHIVRDVLDSLKASIFPRTSYIEGQVNVDDVMNTEIGAAVRMRSPNAYNVHELPFTGEKAFPVLTYLRDVREERTGVNKSNLGLDGSALQSTTQVAAAAHVTGAQAQADLLARIFAETGMKRMFRGILRLLTKHQDTEMQVHLNGRTFKVNPSKWDPDLEMVVDTALGTGLNEQKLQVLGATAAQQKEVLMAYGPQSPLCSVQHYYNTQARILELAGVRDVHRFWSDPAVAQQQGITFPEPKPTPEEVIGKATVAIEERKAELESLKAILQDDRERDKNEADAILRAIEISAKYGTQVDVAAIKALMDRERAQTKAASVVAG